MSKQGALLHADHSPTASTVGNKLFGPSGVITYRVTMQTAMGGAVAVDVDAATGDEAAIAAHAKYPGGKVMLVEPAPKAA